MRLIRGIENIVPISHSVVTVGSFDGVHVGHADVLRQLVREAEIRRGQSVVVTFDPHPRMVIDGSEGLKMINTPQENLELLDKLGVDNVLLVKFDDYFRRLTAEDFVQDILVGRLHIDTLMVGYDNRFGQGAESGSDAMEVLGSKYGFRIKTMSGIELEGGKVSSSRIRALIERGDMTAAAKLLGRPYSLSGVLGWGGVLSSVDPRKITPRAREYRVMVVEETHSDEKSNYNTKDLAKQSFGSKKPIYSAIATISDNCVLTLRFEGATALSKEVRVSF